MKVDSNGTYWQRATRAASTLANVGGVLQAMNSFHVMSISREAPYSSRTTMRSVSDVSTLAASG